MPAWNNNDVDDVDDNDDVDEIVETRPVVPSRSCHRNRRCSSQGRSPIFSEPEAFFLHLKSVFENDTCERHQDNSHCWERHQDHSHCWETNLSSRVPQQPQRPPPLSSVQNREILSTWPEKVKVKSANQSAILRKWKWKCKSKQSSPLTFKPWKVSLCPLDLLPKCT